MTGRVGTFFRILNVRLRFVFLMVVIGVVAGNWESIMNHVDRWLPHAKAAPAGVEYFCPMHLNVVRDSPGNCPICGMPLVERPKSPASGPASRPGPVQVQLTPQKMDMGRIATSTVEFRLLAREFRLVGAVDYDETRQATITARVKGRLDKLLVNYTGQKVVKGDPLALIYSPDLLVAQQELLTAVKAAGENPSATGTVLVDAARRKLALWGLDDKQIEGIVREGKAQTHMTITSPITGIVIDKKALEGKYVMEGDELYKVADLSAVWLQAKLFENEIAGVSPGTAVEITSGAYPDDVFAGRIGFVAYTVDPATRTLAARVEVANPAEKLKPGMYVTATLRLPAGEVAELPAGLPTSRANGATTDALAKAYLALTAQYAGARPGGAAIDDLAKKADALAGDIPAAAALAARARELTGKDLAGQRNTFKAVSDAAIKVFEQAPASGPLYVAYCPMVKANWLAARPEIQNPYDEKMHDCGNILGPVQSVAAAGTARYAVGYYCPLHPGRLLDAPATCAIDNMPMRAVRAEKLLSVPESAVIDTGARTIVYRRSGAGVFDLVEVKLGPRAGEFFPVVAGLQAGDEVATAGAFLVDAENRLNPAAAAKYFGAVGSGDRKAGAE
ncbi:MAG: efflux RND transporter periplasmic adaptor subunit [Planctomycetota bacterium]|nr:efflux RND transporter periplasmic adaptor subunit [Planctomycetota bacterium]